MAQTNRQIAKNRPREVIKEITESVRSGDNTPLRFNSFTQKLDDAVDAILAAITEEGL
jgi:hypothetical protein